MWTLINFRRSSQRPPGLTRLLHLQVFLGSPAASAELWSGAGPGLARVLLAEVFRRSGGWMLTGDGKLTWRLEVFLLTDRTLRTLEQCTLALSRFWGLAEVLGLGGSRGWSDFGSSQRRSQSADPHTLCGSADESTMGSICGTFPVSEEEKAVYPHTEAPPPDGKVRICVSSNGDVTGGGVPVGWMDLLVLQTLRSGIKPPSVGVSSCGADTRSMTQPHSTWNLPPGSRVT
ncbi:hypothetical protein FQA47_005712 [Oryzias melastigma]|uniref:Uncharacterized protein n=1 Tax=Oryzias melastigma TaxID=30732 RepID=A0A834BWQ7_ORYME|nr:hypothetical protein FQA47_005712 [Oryzias melastigma]